MENNIDNIVSLDNYRLKKLNRNINPLGVFILKKEKENYILPKRK